MLGTVLNVWVEISFHLITAEDNFKKFSIRSLISFSIVKWEKITQVLKHNFLAIKPHFLLYFS